MTIDLVRAYEAEEVTRILFCRGPSHRHVAALSGRYPAVPTRTGSCCGDAVREFLGVAQCAVRGDRGARAAAADGGAWSPRDRRADLIDLISYIDACNRRGFQSSTVHSGNPWYDDPFAPHPGDHRPRRGWWTAPRRRFAAVQSVPGAVEQRPGSAESFGPPGPAEPDCRAVADPFSASPPSASALEDGVESFEVFNPFRHPFRSPAWRRKLPWTYRSS